MGRSSDLAGLVEEIVGYDSPIYTHLGDHLRGAPVGDYLAGTSDAIAQASRLAEPVLGPTVRAVARDVDPQQVVDIGCGSGVYLGHVLDVAANATALGIDLDEAVVEVARQNLAAQTRRGRCTVEVMDLDTL